MDACEIANFLASELFMQQVLLIFHLSISNQTIHIEMIWYRSKQIHNHNHRQTHQHLIWNTIMKIVFKLKQIKFNHIAISQTKHTHTHTHREIHTHMDKRCAMHSFDIRVNVWLGVSYIKFLIFDAFLQYAHQLMLLQYCTTTIDAFLLHSWCNSEHNIKWIFTLKSNYDGIFCVCAFFCASKRHITT